MTRLRLLFCWSCNVFRILLLLLAATAPTTCQMEGKIVGGQDASIKLWPFITFIEISKDLKPISVCGGSLISSQTVLTAAHCLDDIVETKLMLNSFRFTIFMGHALYKQATMVRTALDYETPKAYNPNDDNVKSDIGVLFLERPVKFIANVKKVILKRTFDVNQDRYLEVAGWGRTGTNKNQGVNQRLKSVGVTAISIRKCQAIIFSTVSEVICADVSDGYAFSGDSGGPLVNKQDRYQVGVVSFRDEHTGITVYTSVPDYYNWIRDTQWRLFMKHCPPKKQKKLRRRREDKVFI